MEQAEDLSYDKDTSPEEMSEFSPVKKRPKEAFRGVIFTFRNPTLLGTANELVKSVKSIKSVESVESMKSLR